MGVLIQAHGISYEVGFHYIIRSRSTCLMVCVYEWLCAGGLAAQRELECEV